MNVLFLGKADDRGAQEAADVIVRMSTVRQIVWAQRGSMFPADLEWWEGDLIVSYLCPWVIPGSLLRRAKHAINVHPGPPAYPGIGCTNFAIYDGATGFGATCHHMAESVDTGPIIATRLFAVHPEESVLSLTRRTYAEMLVLFYHVMEGRRWTEAGREGQWTKRPTTRADLEELCQVDPSMPAEEIQRRVRATTYPGMPGAWMEVGGVRFEAAR